MPKKAQNKAKKDKLKDTYLSKLTKLEEEITPEKIKAFCAAVSKGVGVINACHISNISVNLYYKCLELAESAPPKTDTQHYKIKMREWETAAKFLSKIRYFQASLELRLTSEIDRAAHGIFDEEVLETRDPVSGQVISHKVLKKRKTKPNWAAAAWKLERLFPGTYASAKTNVNILNANALPDSDPKNLRNMSDDELQAMLEQHGFVKSERLKAASLKAESCFAESKIIDVEAEGKKELDNNNEVCIENNK